MRMIFSALLLFIAQWGQSQEAEPTIVPVKLSDKLYVFYGGNGQGSNVGVLIGEEGILLIDAMVAESSEKLLAAIRKISDKPIRYVVNTHADFDHSGGNAFFAEQGAIIISHALSKYSSALSQVTFEKELMINFNGETIRAWHTSSHAHTDITIYLEQENALFLGDTFSNTWHPTFYAGGMMAQYEVLDLADRLADENTHIVPGHGFITKKEELTSYRQGCESWVTRMGELVKTGESLGQMLTDEKLGALRKQFIARRPEGDMPNMNFQRLIQRTISSELNIIYLLNQAELSQFTGTYTSEGEDPIEVFIRDEKLLAGVPGDYLVELIPVGQARFHLRGWIHHYYEFEKDEQGKIKGLIHQSSDGEKRLKLIQH